MKKILLALLLGGVVYLLVHQSLNTQHSLLLGTIIFLVTLWTNRGLPMGVVSLLPIIIFPSFDILTTNETVANYSKSIIFLFLGGFMLAIATQKTDLHKLISNRLLTIFSNTPRGILFSLAFTSAFLSSLISNTTTALLLIPIALYLTNEKKLKLRFVLAIAYGASIGGVITPIGTPPNLILLGFLESHHEASISFVNWIALTLPLAACMLIAIPYILSIGVSDMVIDKSLHVKTKVTGDQKRLLFILGILVVMLFANSSVEPYYSGLGLNEKGILLGFGLLMFMPHIGFLTWDDTKEIPYKIIFLFGAGFSVATAVSKTGLAQELANYLLALSTLPLALLVFVVAAMIIATTEITSNTALISIALPIIYSLGQSANIDITLILFVATICASYAFMLPIATPPNAIAVSSGVVKAKDMIRKGFVFDILGVCLITLIALVYWQFII